MNQSLSGTSFVAVTSGTSWVSVAEILAHRVPVHGSEAIAMLAALCAVLLERGEEAIPHAADVLLNGDGALSVRGPHRGESDAAALGRMLHDLLDTTQTPVPLRLFVSQAISSERYQSVQAFAEGLASFEGPGRLTLIQAVYNRFVAMPTAVAPSFPMNQPVVETEPSERPAKPNPHRRPLPRWAIASATVAVLVGGATAAWLAGGAHRLAISSVSWTIPAVFQKALPWLATGKPIDTTAADGHTKPTKRPRSARPKTTAAGVRTDSPVLDRALEEATATAVTDPTSATGTVTLPVTTADVTWTARIVSDTPPLAAATAATAPAETGETSDTLDDVATAAESVVYSSAFPEVRPPVMVTSQITAPRSLRPELQAASTIELLVDESGRVTRVRLVSHPSRILAMMLLSAAKTWQFRPALHDGRPVKYLLLLDVMTARH
jgi:hypothetical protein